MRLVNGEDLVPYAHLFYELRLTIGVRANGQVAVNLLNRCCNLRTFMLLGFTDIEPNRMVLTALYQSFPLLEQLRLSGIPLVSLDASVANLSSRHWKHLSRLVLYACGVSTSSLRVVAGMETLTEPNLSQCHELTNAGMAVLSTMRLKIEKFGYLLLPRLDFSADVCGIEYQPNTRNVSYMGHSTKPTDG